MVTRDHALYFCPCAAERDGVSQFVLDEIVSTLMKRLDSDIGLVVNEAAASLADLSESAPEPIRIAATLLTTDPDLRRRMIGIGLVAATGGEVTPEQRALFLLLEPFIRASRAVRVALMFAFPRSQ